MQDVAVGVPIGELLGLLGSTLYSIPELDGTALAQQRMAHRVDDAFGNNEDRQANNEGERKTETTHAPRSHVRKVDCSNFPRQYELIPSPGACTPQNEPCCRTALHQGNQVLERGLRVPMSLFLLEELLRSGR